MNDVFSYVITHDTGFAPNPFGGFCTLATCKPMVRRTARKGDWLVGTGSAGTTGTGTVVYAGQIEDVWSLEAYGASPLFVDKRPEVSGEEWRRHGDNIYFRDSAGEWKQRRNLHHHAEHQARDLGGRNVLICRRFWYFGRSAPQLPELLLPIVKRGPGHRRVANARLMHILVDWLEAFPPGISGQPFEVV